MKEGDFLVEGGLLSILSIKVSQTSKYIKYVLVLNRQAGYLAIWECINLSIIDK